MKKLALLMGRSFLLASLIYTIVVTFVAVLFYFAEDKHSFGTSIWWAFTTATTTGYGDVSPVTFLGRVVGVFLMHFGPGFAFPVMTALITAKMLIDADKFTHDEQLVVMRRLETIEELVRGTNFDDLSELYDRLSSGNFYLDYDEDLRLMGVLRKHLGLA